MLTKNNSYVIALACFIRRRGDFDLQLGPVLLGRLRMLLRRVWRWRLSGMPTGTLLASKPQLRASAVQLARQLQPLGLRPARRIGCAAYRQSADQLELGCTPARGSLAHRPPIWPRLSWPRSHSAEALSVIRPCLASRHGTVRRVLCPRTLVSHTALSSNFLSLA